MEKHSIKTVVLSGKRTDRPYSARIQMIKHPTDTTFTKRYSVHRLPFTGVKEVNCWTTFKCRCPICDALTSAGEPISNWHMSVKHIVEFYGIFLSDNQTVQGVPLTKGELVKWKILGSDFKEIEMILNNFRSSATQVSSYTFDISINPSANFARNEKRCGTAFIEETRLDPQYFGNVIPPLFGSKNLNTAPSTEEIDEFMRAYLQIPVKQNVFGGWK